MVTVEITPAAVPVLAAAISPCTQERHEQMKQSADAFLLGTTDWARTAGRIEVYIFGNCLRCRSSLYYPVRSLVAEQILQACP